MEQDQFLRRKKALEQLAELYGKDSEKFQAAQAKLEADIEAAASGDGEGTAAGSTAGGTAAASGDGKRTVYTVKSLLNFLEGTLQFHKPALPERSFSWEITQREDAVNACFECFVLNKRDRESKTKQDHEFALLWAGPGVGKTTLLGAIPELLAQKLSSLQQIISVEPENFGPLSDNMVNAFYTGIGQILPRLSATEHKDLETALCSGCAVYIDFSNGDGLTAWDAQPGVGASYALGRRIVSRVFQGCSSKYQNPAPDVDPSIFMLDNVLHHVASVLHEKSGNEALKVIILLLDEMNEVIAGRGEEYLREMARAIGSYMCNTTDDAPKGKENHPVGGAVRDKVWLLPLLGGTLAPELFFRLSQYGNADIPLDLFNSMTVEILLKSQLTKELLPLIEEWLKNPHFRALAFSSGRVGRALEYFVRVLLKCIDDLGPKLFPGDIKLIEDTLQQHFQNRYKPDKLVKAYGGDSAAKALLTAALAGVPLADNIQLGGGVTIEEVQTKGYLWRDKNKRAIFPLPTLKSLLIQVGIPFSLPSVSHACTWQDFEETVIDFQWMRSYALAWIMEKKPLKLAQFFHGAVLGSGCHGSELVLAQPHRTQDSDWCINKEKTHYSHLTCSATSEQVDIHRCGTNNPDVDAVIYFPCTDGNRLKASYQFKHKHLETQSKQEVSDSDIQLWYQRVMALHQVEPNHLPPVVEHICVWITNKPLNGNRDTLLQSCPNLVLVTRAELSAFISPVLLELALLVEYNEVEHDNLKRS